jgi:transcription antitermination factor NusG
MKWFVIYTKPNFEIKVAEGINSIGLNAYCPVYTEIKQYSDRKKKVTKPLLKSYVLVQLTDADRTKVFSIPGALRYVFWLGKPAEVRAKEIEILKTNLTGSYDQVSISKLVKGKQYTIAAGPFKGQTGKVLDILKNKLRLELPSLGIFLTLSKATA